MKLLLDFSRDTYVGLKNYLTPFTYECVLKYFNLEVLRNAKTFSTFLNKIKFNAKHYKDIPYLYALFLQGSLFEEKGNMYIQHKNTFHFFNFKETTSSIYWEDFYDSFSIDPTELLKETTLNFLPCYLRPYLNNSFIYEILGENRGEDFRKDKIYSLIKKYIEEKTISSELKEAYYIVSFALLKDRFNISPFIDSVIFHSIAPKKRMIFSDFDKEYEEYMLFLMKSISDNDKYELIGRDILNNVCLLRNFEENREEFIKERYNLSEFFKFINKESFFDEENKTINKVLVFIDTIAKRSSFKNEIRVSMNNNLNFNSYLRDLKINKGEDLIIHSSINYENDYRKLFSPSLFTENFNYELIKGE